MNNSSLTIEALTKYKRLDTTFLQSLGIRVIDSGFEIPYRGADGKLLPRARVRRTVEKSAGFWTGEKDSPIYAYGLNRLKDARHEGYLILVEGESDCWTLWQNSFPALGLPGNTNEKLLKIEYLESIPRIYISQESGPGGNTFVERLTKHLSTIGYRGEIYIFNCGSFKDPSELYINDPENFPQRFEEILATAEPWEPPAEAAPPGAGETAPGIEGKKPEPTVAQVLIELAQDVELFRTEDDRGLASYPVGDHRENAYIKSRTFRRWLFNRYFRKTQKPPHGEGLQQALETLDAMACCEGKLVKTYIRTAESGGNIYIDLGNENWEAVQCTPHGWDVIHHPPVKFLRPKGMKPLPVPQRGGNARDLQRFINVKNETVLHLILSWIVNACRPACPFPVLVLLGEQGSAKSTASEFIRALVDPNICPIRSIQHEERDLMVSAKANWMLVYDNLSGLSHSLSDALCRLSTGGGLSVRELYTDAEEVIFNAMRPIILNGITDIVTRPDLLDRSLIITLEPIPEAERQTKAELQAKFTEAAPAIFGGLLDALCVGLRNLNSVNLPLLPRMADFAQFAVATETGLGYEPGSFMKTYAANQREAVESGLEVDPLAQAIRELVDGEEFEGTMGELLERLEAMSGVIDSIKRSTFWPKTPHKLRASLKRIKPLLEKTGIKIDFLGKKHHGRSFIRVTRKTGETKSPKSPKSPNTLEATDFIEDVEGDIENMKVTRCYPKSPDVTPEVTLQKSNEISELEQKDNREVTLVTFHPSLIGDTVEVEI